MKSNFINKQSKIKSNLRSKLNYVQLMSLACGLVVGLAVGHFLWQKDNLDPRYKLASNSEIKQAEQAISAKFKKQSSLDCNDSTDPIKPNDRQKVFDDYLKVNKYANRAVIRGCGDIDSFLVKDPITGEWNQTSININLNNRANPAWQVECLAEDILLPDSIVRPENSSIDTSNFVGCRKLKEREQIVDILDKSKSLKRSDITQKDIDVYIKAGEDF